MNMPAEKGATKLQLPRLHNCNHRHSSVIFLGGKQEHVCKLPACRRIILVLYGDDYLSADDGITSYLMNLVEYSSSLTVFITFSYVFNP